MVSVDGDSFSSRLAVVGLDHVVIANWLPLTSNGQLPLIMFVTDCKTRIWDIICSYSLLMSSQLTDILILSLTRCIAFYFTETSSKNYTKQTARSSEYTTECDFVSVISRNSRMWVLIRARYEHVQWTRISSVKAPKQELKMLKINTWSPRHRAELLFKVL